MIQRMRGSALFPVLLVAGVALLGALVVFPTSYTHARVQSVTPRAGAPAALVPVASTPSAINLAGLTLSISANPSEICAYGLDTCAAGTGMSQVTMSATAGLEGLETWPAVQVAFVIETTLYDGVYDPGAGDPGADMCATQPPNNVPCYESNGVPFFVAHAQQIANAIQTANPHSTVSFALVDYFASLTDFDDGDGTEYHVDLPSFIPASQFGADVQATFQAQVLGGGYVYGDSDFSDNFLHSSSITALYGTIIGSGLNWAPDTHHVIVWIGSTTPRDPSYTVNYCVSPSDYGGGINGCNSNPCEPSYNYGTLQSPNCEGWVRSPDTNKSHSIAGLARSVPECTQSVGGVCTVDTIDLYDTPTDPYSPGWPTGAGQGPGSAAVIRDSDTILQAGCDLATATSGSWDGPNFFSCNGQQGTLLYVPHGPAFTPNLQNPSLLAALRGVSFGPVVATTVANGTNKPIFQYVPIGAISMVPGYAPSTFCQLANGQVFNGCSHRTVNGSGFGVPAYFGWNWSDNPATNVMRLGDMWRVTFLVWANGPPFTQVPVDACKAGGCANAGSHALEGLFTWATYQPITGVGVVTQSYPVATVTVQPPPPSPAPPTVPPPAPPVPPPFAVPVGTPVPVATPIGIGAQVGLGSVALQGVAAGLLAAGFIRIGVKNRPIAMAVAAMAGKRPQSKIEQGMKSGQGPELGRFE